MSTPLIGSLRTLGRVMRAVSLLPLLVLGQCARSIPADSTGIAWKWKLGECRRFRLEVRVQDEDELSRQADAITIRETRAYEQVWRFEAVEIDLSDTVTLEATCESLRLVENSMGASGETDSGDSESEPNDLAVAAKVYYESKKGLLGLTVRMKMNRNGELRSNDPKFQDYGIRTAENLVSDLNNHPRHVFAAFTSLFAGFEPDCILTNGM